jgi:hypothetical protein
MGVGNRGRRGRLWVGEILLERRKAITFLSRIRTVEIEGSKQVLHVQASRFYQTLNFFSLLHGHILKKVCPLVIRVAMNV